MNWEKRWLRIKGLIHNQLQIRRIPPLRWQLVQTVQPGWLTGVKVLLLGLDAAEWNLINPLIAAGRLPHLESLIRSGSSGRLGTLFPAQSPVVWNSIATGKRPGKHGIRGFVVRHPESGKRMPYTSNMRKCKTIWEILSEHHRRVGVVGWWNSWPATPVNGAMVCGVTRYKVKDFREDSHDPTHESARPPARNSRPREGRPGTHEISLVEFPRKSALQTSSAHHQTYPEWLFDQIRPLIREHSRLDDSADFVRSACMSNAGQDETEQFLLDLLVQIFNDDRTYADVGKFLLEKNAPDFLAVYIAGLDVIGHKFWIYMEPDRFDVRVEPIRIQKYGRVLRDYYSWVDSVIGEYLQMIDSDTSVVILSDHGMSPSHRAWRVSRGVASADHTDEDGVIILSGRPFKPGYRIPRASVLDITPTLLAAMGLPVASDMDGRALRKAFTVEFLARHPVRYVHTYEEGPRGEAVPIESPMDDEILDRLRALGYIE